MAKSSWAMCRWVANMSAGTSGNDRNLPFSMTELTDHVIFSRFALFFCALCVQADERFMLHASEPRTLRLDEQPSFK